MKYGKAAIPRNGMIILTKGAKSRFFRKKPHLLFCFLVTFPV